MISLADFQADETGKVFTDVVGDPRISFSGIVDWFNDPARRQRMVDAEIHFGVPALAGVVRELEIRPDVDQFFRNHDGHTTRRFKQALGVLARMHMEQMRFEKTGRKGSLGVRQSNPTPTTLPGAYYNTAGLSRWFTRAERYVPVGGGIVAPVSGTDPSLEACAGQVLTVQS